MKPRAKAQWVRLADVFFVGPVMIYVAARGGSAPNIARLTLFGLGIATIIYNGQNYLRLAK